MNRRLLGCCLLLAAGCVDDVWLGPELASPPSAVDAGADGGGAIDGGDDGGLAFDAGGPEPDAGDDDGGAPLLDAPSQDLRIELCGFEDCVAVQTTPGMSPDRCSGDGVCWPAPDGNSCSYACAPAPRCGRTEDAPCPSDTFCLYANAASRCGGGPALGYCAPYPSNCERSAPGEACGCDGVTYASECEAARIGGVSIAFMGACEPGPVKTEAASGGQVGG